MDLLSDALRRDPFPVYDQLRASAPVLRDPRSGLWMILDYESAKRALSDPETYCSDLAGSAQHPTPDWLGVLDPPRHAKLRGLITRAFTPRSVANLEPRIRALSRGFLDAVIERGTMDLAADYAVP